MLSLHRLTLAVIGADDDGSVKRIRRRSKRDTVRHPASHRRHRLPFDWDSFDAGVGSSSSSLMSSLSLKIGGRPGGGPGGLREMTMRGGRSIGLDG